jgi:hypothetical protein
MRNIATRQLISRSRPSGRRQFSCSHTRRDSGVRLTVGFASIKRATAYRSSGLKSRPLYRFIPQRMLHRGGEPGFAEYAGQRIEAELAPDLIERADIAKRQAALNSKLRR